MSAPAYKGSQETVEAAKVLQTNIMLSEFFFHCLFVCGFSFLHVSSPTCNKQCYMFSIIK